MSNHHFFANINTLLENTFYFILSYWPSIIALTLVCSLVLLALRKRTQSITKRQSQNAITPQRQNFSNLYNRIHNYQSKNPTEATTSHASTENGTPTNNHYHHVIKLLHRGMDRKALLEYCNITVGEIELLEAIYGHAKE